MANITVTPDELKKSAAKFRTELLSMPIIGLQNTLQYMTLRTGIQYKETVGQITDGSEVGPYDPTRKSGDVAIAGRTLEVFLGSVIKEFDPNTVIQSLYGSLLLKGDGLKNVPIAQAVLAAMMKSISKKLNMAVFSAVRDDAGTTSQKLFNGFDTIAAAEITANNISTAKGNLFNVTDAIDSTNAVDALKSAYRAASDELKEEQSQILVPYYVAEAYDDDYKTVTGAIPYNSQFKQRFLEGSNGKCEIVALSSKRNSKLLQLTTKGNLLVGTGTGSDLESIEVDKYSSFLVTMAAALLFGVQYETISSERLLIAKLPD